jgi:hypothetical protein
MLLRSCTVTVIIVPRSFRRCKPKPAAELFEIESQTEEGDVSLE